MPASLRSEAPPPESFVQQIRSVGDLCKRGEVEAAAAALRSLYDRSLATYGAGHSITEIVSMNLDGVDRARGRTPEPRAALSVEQSTAVPVDPTMERAIKKLRACSNLATAVARRSQPGAAGAGMLEGGFAVHLEAARALATKGQYRAAVVAASRAAELIDDADSDHERLRSFEALALLRLQVGDRPDAVDAARHADALAKKLGATSTRIAMARLFAQARRLEDARATLASVADAAAKDLAVLAEWEEAEGELALHLGAPGRASGHFARALELHRQRFGPDHGSVAAVQQLRGDALRMAGDFPGAQRAYMRALEIREAVYGRGHPEIARSRNALGVLYADLSDWGEADRAFARALTSLVEELGLDHPEVVTVRSNRALVSWIASKGSEAATDYAVTVDALAHSYGDDHPLVSEARLNLAQMEEELGRNGRAESLFDLALEAQLRALGADHPALAPTRLAHGRFLARSGRLEEAEVELERAVQLLRVHYGDDHPLVARARTELSRVATVQRDPETAWAQAHEAARVFDLYLRRSFGALPDRQRSLLALDAEHVVGALLSAQEVSAREVYIALIPQRDSVLRSIATHRARLRRRSVSNPRLFAEIDLLRARYVAEILSDSPRAAARARKLANDIDAQEMMVSLAPDRTRTLDAPEILRRACARLSEDAAVIEFVSYDRSEAGRSGAPIPAFAAFVLRPAPDSSPGSAHCVTRRIELGAAAPIDEAADRFARAMREQRSDAPEARKRLGELLLDPLRGALAGSARWSVVPDASLWGIPLWALPDPESKDHYLIERVTLGTLTSIHQLAEAFVLRPSSEMFSNALLFGAPDFGRAEDAGGPLVMTKAGPCRIEPFAPLPATEFELEQLGRLLEGATLVLGAAATKARLRAELTRHPEILHLATHAYFAGSGGCGAETGVAAEASDGLRVSRAPVGPNPLLLSGIVFAGANASGEVALGETAESKSGILTAYEAAGLDLTRSRLVVLSACDTGTGLRGRGQEIQGLRWGFRAAGAGSLVTSIWRSNDVVTRKLMMAFYRALGSAEVEQDFFRGAEALRQAQLLRIAGEKRLGRKSPLTWANFVFSGIY